MSKSVGNVVNPFFALNRFGVDTMRYYLAHDGGIKDDADYENAYIIMRYKKGLQFGLGNLSSRLLRGKKWSVREAVQYSAECKDAIKIEKAAKGDESGTLNQDTKHHARLIALPNTVAQKMNDLDPGAALQAIMETIYQVTPSSSPAHSRLPHPTDNPPPPKTNTYMHQAAPWGLVKSTPSNLAQLNKIIYLCAESLRICGILLQPYMPSKMAELLDMLGVAPDARTFQDAVVGLDSRYGEPATELGKGYDGVLFPPLRSES